MCAVEGKIRIVMIEVSGFPGGLGMALQAVGREAQIDMIGIFYRVVFFLVAVDAVARRIDVDPVGMAADAIRADMCAIEREAGGIVIGRRTASLHMLADPHGPQLSAPNA